MIITDKEFYQNFQADYFAYRQKRLKRELDSLLLAPNPIDEIVEYSHEDHLRSIKIDIRQTYFQAIETVFELIFSFKPTNGRLRDDLVLANLIKRKDHYEEIRKFADDKDGLKFLDDEFDLGSYGKINAAQYIFYGVLTNDQIGGHMQESLKAIKKILKIIAKDISDRKEYNSYKHGLRIFPVSSSLSVHNHQTMEKILDWDIKDSMSFIEKDEKTGQVDVITKLFDPERDHNMTIMCNNLISNIFVIRRSTYLPKDVKSFIVTFKCTNVDEQSKPNVKIQDLKFSSTPINK